MMQEMDWHSARAILQWHVELGATEAICDAPIDRYALPANAPSAPLRTTRPGPAAPHISDAPANRPPAISEPLPAPDPITIARQAASQASTLAELRDALATFDHCDLRNGARNLVFADGQPEARVLILGGAPDRDEDRIGTPFVGQAGQLLDRMFAAIGLRRDAPDPGRALYITNLLPWRPPNDRAPSPAEQAMMRPFAEAHIELANPDIVILMGRVASCTILDSPESIASLRGQWHQIAGRPALPMLHPSYLLRNPENKRHAWADLLTLQARARTLP